MDTGLTHLFILDMLAEIAIIVTPKTNAYTFFLGRKLCAYDS